MSVLKRWITLIRTHADSPERSVVKQGAASPAAIVEANRIVARGRTGLERVRQEGAVLRSILERHRAEILRWERRAGGFAPVDETRALACIERRNRALRRAEAVTGLLREHQRLLRRLEREIARAEALLERDARRRRAARPQDRGADIGVSSPEYTAALANHPLLQRLESEVAAMATRARALSEASALHAETLRDECEQALRKDLAALLRGRFMQTD